MTQEQLEFAISQYLDGTLPPEERSELERILLADASARRVLEEYRRLDAALKRSGVSPAVDYEGLSERISAAVDADVVGGEELDEETELAITEYVDGELSGVREAEVKGRIERSEAARRVARKYASLNHVLKQGWVLPAINWERLAGHLSDVVSAAAERERYSLVWLRRVVEVAAAACLAVVLGVPLYQMLSSRGPGSDPWGGREVERVAKIEAFITDGPVGRPVADISIGAANEVADARYAFGEIVGRSAGRLSITTMASEERTGSEGSIFQQ